MEINTINLVGRAGREPDVRYFESGSIVAKFTLAVNRRSRDEEPDWFNLENFESSTKNRYILFKKEFLL